MAVKYTAMCTTDCESCSPGSSVDKTLVSFWETGGSNVTFGEREKGIIWGDWGIVVELRIDTQLGKGSVALSFSRLSGVPCPSHA